MTAPTARKGDYQRSRVYDAEFVLRSFLEDPDSRTVALSGGITLTLPPEARFGSIQSIQAYVSRVLAMHTVIRAFGEVPTPWVRERKGDKLAHYHPGKGEIAIAVHGTRWALREIVVLHELAHHINLVANGGSGHDAGFTATLRTLVGLVLGPEVELALRVLYDEAGVDQ